jgi:hypothetical protein
MNHTSGNVHYFDAILSFHRVCDFRPAQYMFTGTLPYMLFGANPRLFYPAFWRTETSCVLLRHRMKEISQL